jgi:hypothetical protein
MNKHYVDLQRRFALVKWCAVLVASVPYSKRMTHQLTIEIWTTTKDWYLIACRFKVALLRVHMVTRTKYTSAKQTATLEGSRTMDVAHFDSSDTI